MLGLFNVAPGEERCHASLPVGCFPALFSFPALF